MAGKKRKQIHDRNKRIKKNKIMIEERKKDFSKEELLLKFALLFVSSSLGIGLYFYLLSVISNGNTMIENLGMVIEGILFLLASVYMVSVLKDILKSNLKSCLASFVVIIAMYYISQMFSVFLLLTLDKGYIDYMAELDFSKFYILKNTLMNLHKTLFGFFSLDRFNNIFDSFYSSCYISSFFTPIIVFFKK